VGDWKTEERLSKWAVEAALLRAGLSDHEKNMTFATFDPQRTAGPRVFELCKEYAEKVEKGMGIGLTLWGPRGVGKTHLAIAILREAISRGLEGTKIPFADLIAKGRSYFTEDELSEDFLDVEKFDLVVLDDLALQSIVGSYDSARACEVLFRFLDLCYIHRVNLIITTNHSPSELASELRRIDGSERILDRLRGLTWSVLVQGESQRAKEKEKRTPEWLKEKLQLVKEV
jgi:DNA replication protein DnaC